MIKWVKLSEEMPPVGETVLCAYDMSYDEMDCPDYEPDYVSGLWKREPSDTCDAESMAEAHWMTHWARIEFPNA